MKYGPRNSRMTGAKTMSTLTDAQRAVLKTHGIVDPDAHGIVEFEESGGLLTFANGDVKRICDVYSRVMGYHRPTHAFNAGKQQEHKDRQLFQESRVRFLEGAGHD